MIPVELQADLRRIWEQQQRSSLFPILSSNYRTLPLSRGMNTLVDVEDFRRFRYLRWHAIKSSNTYYVHRKGKVSEPERNADCIMLHRDINSTPRGCDTHHINRDGLDNVRDNLETRTRLEHGKARQKRNGTFSKFKGVCKYNDRFMAAIVVDGLRIHLGVYDTEIDAALAYDNGSEYYHGRFGSTNEQQFGRYWETG